MANFRPRAWDVGVGRGGTEGSELRFSAGRTGGRAHLRRSREPRSAVTSQPGGTRPGAAGLAWRGQTGCFSGARSQARVPGRWRGGEARPAPTRSPRRSLPLPRVPRAPRPGPCPAARRRESSASRRCRAGWAQESSNPRPAAWLVCRGRHHAQSGSLQQQHSVPGSGAAAFSPARFTVSTPFTNCKHRACKGIAEIFLLRLQF